MLKLIWLKIRKRILAIYNYFKGVLLMMAMLFACRLVEGRTTSFDLVPKNLKKPVADVLINDFALPELVPVEFGGTLGAETK